MTDSELRALAERIVEELPTLISDGEERARVDRALRHALSQPPPANAALSGALRSHQAVHDRLRQDDDRAAVGLPGDSTTPIGVLFVCPRRDYSVVREVVTSEAPLCPHDGAVLERYEG